MQTTNEKDILKRARYYSSVIDNDVLQKGHEYYELKENIIIFLCLTDPFDKGISQYTFKTKCLEDDTLADDGTTKIFYNINKWKEASSKDVMNFLGFIKTGKVNDSFTSSLNVQVLDAKKNADYRRQYMTLKTIIKENYRNGLEDGIMKGVEQGKKDTALENAILAVKTFKVSPELVAKTFNVPLDELLKRL